MRTEFPEAPLDVGRIARGRSAAPFMGSVALNRGEHVTDSFDVLLYATVRSVDYKMIAAPIMIFSGHYIAPAWEFQSRNIADSCFNASSMFVQVRTSDFYFYGADADTFRDGEPCVTGDLNRIDGVCNNSMSDTQVIFCNGIGDSVSDIGKILLWGATANGLFYRVDAKVKCTELTGQLSGNSVFPTPDSPLKISSMFFQYASGARSDLSSSRLRGKNGASGNYTDAVRFGCMLSGNPTYRPLVPMFRSRRLRVAAQSRIVGKSDTTQELPSIVFYDKVVLV